MVILLISVISISIYDFKVRININSTEQALTFLEQKTDYTIKSFENMINGQYDSLDKIALTIAALEDTDQESISSILDRTAVIMNATSLSLVSTSGIGVTSENEILDVSDKSYFKEALSGVRSLADQEPCLNQDKKFIVLAIPFKQNGEITGVLHASYNYTSLNNLLIASHSDNDQYTYIIDQYGIIITTNNPYVVEGTSLSEMLYQFEPNDLTKMMVDLKERKVGSISGVMNDEVRLAYYSPTFNDNWYILSGLPNSYMQIHEDSINTSLYYFCFKLISCFAILIIYIFYTNRKQNKLLTDSYNDTRIAAERYQLLSEMTNTIVFEYNLETKCFICNDNYYEHFAYDLEAFMDLKQLASSKLVHPDDHSIISEILESIKNGQTNIQKDLRFIDKLNNYVWYTVRLSFISARNGRLLRVLGDMHNIDIQKKEMEDLRIIANHDSLTSLYNKKMTTSLIDEYLSKTDFLQQKKNALMIIDIDDFKGINDHLGHMFGDLVLSELGKSIKNLFRSNDVVGRIGGDEFVVFLKNVEIETIEKKANEICEIFKRSYTGTNSDYKISGSIGIALTPNDGKTFNELYANADTALYRTKNNGKDGYAFFGNDELMHSQSDFSNHDLEEWSLFTQDSIKTSFEYYIFSLFYNSDDLISTTKFVLDLVTEQFDFDSFHLLIGNKHKESRIMYANSEEVNHDFSIRLVNLVNESSDFYDSFDQQGIIFCNNTQYDLDPISQLYQQLNIFSYLQIAFHDEKDLQGFVSIGANIPAKEWSLKEIDSICFIVKILGIFIIKHNLREQVSQLK